MPDIRCDKAAMAEYFTRWDEHETLLTLYTNRLTESRDVNFGLVYWLGLKEVGNARKTLRKKATHPHRL